MTERTKYVAVIVGGTPEEPWDVEREYEEPSIVVAAARADTEAFMEFGKDARVTSIKEWF